MLTPLSKVTMIQLKFDDHCNALIGCRCFYKPIRFEIDIGHVTASFWVYTRHHRIHLENITQNGHVWDVSISVLNLTWFKPNFWSTGVQLLVFFCSSVPVVLFDTPGISRCRSQHVSVESSSLLHHSIYLWFICFTWWSIDELENLHADRTTVCFEPW